jgi:streptomycin 6-kinase
MPPSSWVSDDLRRRWRNYWPDADIERMAGDVERRTEAALAAWGLLDPAPLPGGHVAVVLATADRVLKVNPRGHDDDALIASQGAALEHWRATGIVPALHGSRDDGFTILIERVRPGTTLDEDGLPFEEHLRVLGGLARRLHGAGPAPATFVDLATYAARWEPGELATRRADDVLLHADLHGGNVLRDGDGWTVIDPHAVRGERHAEVWALLDPLVPPVPDAATAHRWLALYADAAGLDRERARTWTRVRGAGEAREVAAEDPAWAERLARMAEALGDGREGDLTLGASR